eukprot:5711141-Pyramimonas_sp.AAC.1
MSASTFGNFGFVSDLITISGLGSDRGGVGAGVCLPRHRRSVGFSSGSRGAPANSGLTNDWGLHSDSRFTPRPLFSCSASGKGSLSAAHVGADVLVK